MKKNIKRLFCAILICASLVELTSCDKLFPVQEINPQDIDLADLEWDLDFPYEVYMSAGAAQELKDAYADFIEAPVSALTDDTYMVILDHLSDLPEAQLVELYLNDVVIAVLNPVQAEFKALFEKYPEMGYFLENDGIDGAKLVAVSSWNNGFYIIPDEAQFMEKYSFETDHPTVPNPADAAVNGTFVGKKTDNVIAYKGSFQPVTKDDTGALAVLGEDLSAHEVFYFLTS